MGDLLLCKCSPMENQFLSRMCVSSLVQSVIIRDGIGILSVALQALCWFE